jgi:putative FmdB family regulatory protein
MPIYEYRCESCGSQHEVLQKLSEPPLRTCPQCAKDSLVKLVSAAGFQLKGSGWYATDFKGSGAAKKPDEGKSETQSETKTEAKADAKPEAKTETKPAASAPSTGSGA